MSLKIIHTKNLRWIDVVKPGTEEINYLRTNFDFHPLDYEQMLVSSQHAKMESHPEYQHIILIFPVFNRKTREILPAEVDFFVGKDFVVTVHDGSMYTMLHIFENVHKITSERQEFMSKNSGYLLYQILESLFRRSFPILDHITKDMTEIEKDIFDDLSLPMLEKISLMKRNIIDFRRIMKTHHLILKRIMVKKEAYMVFPESRNFYTALLEHAENIWDILSIQKETIEALAEANTSLATNHLNQTTKIVTVLSALFLPASFVMFFFALHLPGQPFENTTNGFWIILGIAISGSLTLFMFFKSKKWF